MEQARPVVEALNDATLVQDDALLVSGHHDLRVCGIVGTYSSPTFCSTARTFILEVAGSLFTPQYLLLLLVDIVVTSSPSTLFVSYTRACLYFSSIKQMEIQSH